VSGLETNRRFVYTLCEKLYHRRLWMVIIYMCSRWMLQRIGQFHQEKYMESY